MKEEKRFLIYTTIVFLLALFIFTIGILLNYYLDIIIAKNSSFKDFRNFAKNLFLWEAVFVLSVGYLFYCLFSAYLKHKKESQEIFHILLQTISHRFGNFLATQKINVELLRNNYRLDVIKRMEDSLRLVEFDLQQIISVLKNFESQSLDIEWVDISKVVKELLENALYDGLDIKYHLGKVKVKSSYLLIKSLIALLLENAFKYAASKVVIRTGFCNGKGYFYVSNDIKEKISPGSGLGLKLARFLSEKSKAKLVTKTGLVYQVLVVWSVSKR